MTVGNGGGDLRINGRRRDTPERAEPIGYLVRSSGHERAAAEPSGRRAGDRLSVRAGLVVTGHGGPLRAASRTATAPGSRTGWPSWASSSRTC